MAFLKRHFASINLAAFLDQITFKPRCNRHVTCACNLSELFNHVHDLNSAVQPKTKQRILLIKYATPLEAGGLCITRLCAKRDVTCCTDLVCDLSTHSREEEVHAVGFWVGVFNSADCSPDAGYVLAHHESI